MTVNSTRRGASLIELMISCFLLTILLTLSHLALIEAVKKQKSLREEISLQQDALAVLTKISREASEGHSDTLWPERTANTAMLPPAGEPTGFVFLSPRNSDGRMELDPTNNLRVWQKRVCYLFDPTRNGLFRAEDPLVAPSSTAPPRDDSKTTLWFRDNTALDPLPGFVENFEIQVGDTVEQLRFTITMSSQVGAKKRTVEFLASTTLGG